MRLSPERPQSMEGHGGDEAFSCLSEGRAIAQQNLVRLPAGAATCPSPGFQVSR